MKPCYRLKIREAPGQPFVDLWLIRHDGPASHSILFGEVLPQLAEEIIDALNLGVDREISTITLPEIPVPGCDPVAKQRNLFD